MTPTPDEIECLVAVAKRLPTQHKLVEKYGSRLIQNGLIELSHEWPILTRRGIDMLNDISFRLITTAAKVDGRGSKPGTPSSR